MKTSNVLASLLFGSLAAAAPVNKRDYVTKTEVVWETVLVYTTVYDGEAPSTVAAATSQPGLFYEKPHSASTSAAAQPASSAPAYTPSAAPQQPSSTSVYTPPAYTPPAVPSSSVVNTPAPVPTSSAVYTPPAPSSVYTPPPAPVSSAAPVSSSPPTTGGGNEYHGDITIYDNTGAAGACGKPLYDSDSICAIAHGLWDAKGGSTYDYMTGAATNPYCGKTATIKYNGNTVTCTIMDMCPGCAGNDLDLSAAVWQKLTGSTEKTRYQADWSVAM